MFAAARELECVDLATLLEPPMERVDHLLTPVTDPLLAQPLPADVGIEQRRRSFEITAAKRAEESIMTASRFSWPMFGIWLLLSVKTWSPAD